MRFDYFNGDFREVKGRVVLSASLSPLKHRHPFFALYGGHLPLVDLKKIDALSVGKQYYQVCNEGKQIFARGFFSDNGNLARDLDSNGYELVDYTGEISDLNEILVRIFNKYMDSFHGKTTPFREVNIEYTPNANLCLVPGWDKPHISYYPNSCLTKKSLLDSIRQETRPKHRFIALQRFLAKVDPSEENSMRIVEALNSLNEVELLPPGSKYQFSSCVGLRKI